MDHHCPWLNTCVGFFNRKYFILLLSYTLLMLLLSLLLESAVAFSFFTSFHTPKGLETTGYSYLDLFFLIIAAGMTMLLFTIMCNFLWFHAKLIDKNRTTIENLENERTVGDKKKENLFDVGRQMNWEQVMGKNLWFWPVPYIGSLWKPYGDGVVFPKTVADREVSMMDKTLLTHHEEAQPPLPPTKPEQPSNSPPRRLGLGGGNQPPQNPLQQKLQENIAPYNPYSRHV